MTIIAFKNIFAYGILALSLTVLSVNASSNQDRKYDTRTSHTTTNQSYKNNSKRNEQLVVEFYDKIFNQRLDVEMVATQYLAEDYIQHNPNILSGRQAFIDLFSRILPANPNRISDIHQVITDGDTVALHVHAYTPGSSDPGLAIVDIFRVSNGKIVEHWDVIQQIPTQPLNGIGMF